MIHGKQNIHGNLQDQCETASNMRLHLLSIDIIEIIIIIIINKSTDLSDTLQIHAAGALYKITKVLCAYQYCSFSETTGETSKF